MSSLLFLVLAVIGTTTTTMMIAGSIGITTSQAAWAEVIPGTEGPDEIVGTPEADLIDSKGGFDQNFGDTFFGDGSGNDVIYSGEDGDINSGDTVFGDGSGNDVIDSGEGDDSNTGDTFFGNGFGNDVIDSGEGDVPTLEVEDEIYSSVVMVKEIQ